jgi:HK97 family phage major capsid protein
LVSLQFELPEEYASRGTYLMNARTLGMVMTMSDATGRPLWMQTPATDAGGRSGFTIGGKPVRIVSQLPDVAPGSTPVLFADLEQLYLVVTRRALTLVSDPYSAGAGCVKFNFSARIGGSTVCPGAGRLLRIR